MLMMQLPQQVQVEIFRKFLFADFLMQFRRFFRFRKSSVVDDMVITRA